MRTQHQYNAGFVCFAFIMLRSLQSHAVGFIFKGPWLCSIVEDSWAAVQSSRTWIWKDRLSNADKRRIQGQGIDLRDLDGLKSPFETLSRSCSCILNSGHVLVNNRHLASHTHIHVILFEWTTEACRNCHYYHTALKTTRLSDQAQANIEIPHTHIPQRLYRCPRFAQLQPS
jgi:hypothetical protein